MPILVSSQHDNPPSRCSAKAVEAATGVELDPLFADAAETLRGKSGLHVINGDFTKQKAPTHVFRSDVLDVLIGGTVLVTSLVLAGLIFQAIGSARDGPRFPPPGQLHVTLWGLHCLGHSSPGFRLPLHWLDSSVLTNVFLLF